MTSMRHEHLPALNRYTSPNQYAALQEIDKTNSLISLITQGRMGTTLGALVRSAWIDSEVIKDEQGTTSERWFVTDAGKHAMQLFDIKLEQDRKKEEAAAEINKIREAQRKQQAELTQAAEKAIIEYYMLYKKLTQVVNDKWRVTTKAAMHAGMDKSKFNRLCEIAKHQAGRDDHNEEPF